MASSATPQLPTSASAGSPKGSALCPRCGFSARPRARFCRGCGGNLEKLRTQLGEGILAGLNPRLRDARISPAPPRRSVPPPAPSYDETDDVEAGASEEVAAAPRRVELPPPEPEPATEPPALEIPDFGAMEAVPAAEDEDLFAGMVRKQGDDGPDLEMADAPPSIAAAASAFELPEEIDEPPDLPPMRPGVIASPPPAPPRAAPAPPRPAAAPPARAPAPPPPAPAASLEGLNFGDLDTSLGGNSGDDVDFSSLSSPAMAADEGASFYDLDALSSSGAPVPPAEGGEAVYDLDSFFSGSGPIATSSLGADAAAPAAPPRQDLVDFSALSTSEPSAYDLDSLSLLGGTDPFASLLMPTGGGKHAAGDSAIAHEDVLEMENELARAAGSTGVAGARKPARGTPCLVVYQNNRAVLYYSLGQEETFLGKDDAGGSTFPGLDLGPFDSTGAITSSSEPHATVLCEGNKYLIQDIESSSGTKVNGSLIPKGQKIPLKDGDSLLLGGKVLLRFEVMK